MIAATDYDTIPYPSHAYRYSVPENIAAIAQIFSLPTADIHHARVLELGCASGGNLLPLALRFPEADFTGIDLSSKQIEQATALAEQFGLKNITFKAESITDLDLQDQHFDYIIAHGVYSWVPKEVQEAILRVCNQYLSDKGLAFVSYNTLPGWNAVRTVRDMMLYHTQPFETPEEKVSEARKMLHFVSENIRAEKGPYKQILEQEIATLKNADDNYLLHDHLEYINDPCYFHSFMAQAEAHDLMYVADADLPAMYLGNQTAQAAETLTHIPDIVRQEQYIDFINNRRFRMTLLTKKGREFTRNVQPDVLQDLYLLPNFALKEPLNLEALEAIENLDLVAKRDPSVTATIKGHALCCCYVALLRAAPQALSVREMIEEAKKLAPKAELEAIETDPSLLRLLFGGVIAVTAAKPHCVTTISKKPEVFVLARKQALSQHKVTDLRHETIILSDSQRVIIQYVDGKHDLEALVQAVRAHIQKGELTITANDAPITLEDPHADTLLEQYLQQQLQFFMINGLLIQ